MVNGRDSLGDGLARVGKGKQRLARVSEWTAYCFFSAVVPGGKVLIIVLLYRA